MIDGLNRMYVPADKSVQMVMPNEHITEDRMNETEQGREKGWCMIIDTNVYQRNPPRIEKPKNRKPKQESGE